MALVALSVLAGLALAVGLGAALAGALLHALARGPRQARQTDRLSTA